ncbi:MAG: hypothetical protein Q8928_07690 [Bacteroidota bacterium]|nr:hypothetical protein [Bacteroidota bacterium]
MKKISLITLSLCLFASAFSAEWQWSVLAKAGKYNKGESRAFLWIPEGCTKVKGVVLAQHNMEEISILENPIFRKGLAELGFAEVWCAPSFDHLFHFNEGAGDIFNALMDDLANSSGYNELKYVPIVGIGHSAAASWPYYFAAWNPERTLAAISVSGQWPYFRHSSFAPDIWGDRNIDFIPCLETMGEYEAAATWSAEGLKERQQHPFMPQSMLACPGEGHFAASDKKVAYLILFLKKAVQYRMPKNVSGEGPIKLLPVDPSKTGWLAEKWIPNQAPSVPSAPVSQYKGNPAQAFWFFDEEMVRATEKYQEAFRDMKPQLVGIVQNGKIVLQENSHLQLTPKFLPQADGLTFELKPAFYDSVPAGSPRLPNWTGLTIGSPVGHSANGNITIERICGPFVKLGPEIFSVRFDRTGISKTGREELVFAVVHPGDIEYKQAVQQAHIFIPVKNAEGAEQQIAFPKIRDLKKGVKAIQLKASSSAGVSVYYYVLEGPAEIEGNTLRFTQIPPRSKFPIKVTVVAWQYGRSTEPKLKSAEPVLQTFYIVK